MLALLDRKLSSLILFSFGLKDMKNIQLWSPVHVKLNLRQIFYRRRRSFYYFIIQQQ